MDGEKIERLILLVSEYNELFDMSNKNYSNQITRENIWAKIGKEINESAETCKQKWKSVRDAFQRVARNNKTKSGQAAKTSKKWKYWDIMSFLLPHIKGRLTHSNVEAEQKEDESDKEEFENIEQNEIGSKIEDNRPDGDEEDIMCSSVISSQPNTPLSQTSSVRSISISKKKRIQSRKVESLPEILREYVSDKKRSRLEKHAKPLDDSLLEFFCNMGKTVATFPPLWQATVKNKVFQIVNSLELQLLSNTSAPLATQTPKNNQTSQNELFMQNQTPTVPSNSPSYSLNDQPQNHTLTSASKYYATFVPNAPPTLQNPNDNNALNPILQQSGVMPVSQQSFFGFNLHTGEN